MNAVSRWMFDSPGRWLRVRLWTSLAMLTVAILLTASRCGGGRSAPAAVPAAPTTTSTALVPAGSPSAAPTESQVGPPDPIALEAVDAFLRHDVDAFARLATPQAADLMAESPGATGLVTGDVTLVHGGPTQQDLDVPTSLGVLRLQMVVRGDRWLVADMAFR